MAAKNVLKLLQKYMLSKSHFSSIPVSYTHLDVYKRQVYSLHYPLILALVICSKNPFMFN